MELTFYKYHGTGNDFILIDARDLSEELFPKKRINFLCDRHFGIGADGLILLFDDPGYDFLMKYFNADGKEGTMCGNGGRCISAFARQLKIINKKAVFNSIDGLHRARFNDDGTISLKMSDVTEIRQAEDGILLETGSRHFVQFLRNIDSIDVFSEGKKIRYQDRFGEEGTNANFVEFYQGNLKVRTYERGVENETLSCGTGCVAAAISAHIKLKSDIFTYKILTSGGELNVSFNPQPDGTYRDIWLTGPVKYVFNGKILLKDRLSDS